MKILLVSDTHLGFRAYNKVDPATGLNVREKDVYDAWKRVVNVDLKVSPDAAVIAGDLFDCRRPPAYAISLVEDYLVAVDHPVIVVCGNHDNDGFREQSPLRVLSRFTNVHLFTEPGFATVGGVRFYCVPYAEEGVIFKDADILVGHLRDNRVPEFKSSPVRIPEQKYQLALLGDLHRPVEVVEGVYYGGTIERLDFSQENIPCGVYVFEDTTPTYIELPGRKFVTITEAPADISKLEGAVVRCRVRSLAPWIQEVRRVALHVTVDVQSETPKQDFEIKPLRGTLLERFRQYCDSIGAPTEAVKMAEKALEEALESVHSKS